MGSTGTRRERGMSDRGFFEQEFPVALTQHGKIIACTSKPAASGADWNRVFYAAVQNTENAPYAPGQTWALIILMRTERNLRDWCNFYYKDMSEESGPGEDTCPDRILDLLSPTDHEYASNWRERCRANSARREAARNLASGQIVRFANSMWFGDAYGFVSRFRFTKEGRKVVFVALTDDDAPRFRAHITRWQERAFEIETA
ncbi:DUF6927 domain-containing protein [Nonomuraea typhae]|uniref:DUF6927 domain-containing protein n=1 Tax=Nonomuraea typhae TaxID=2603600 RepID=A0ABW7YJA1_9ACTN